MTNLDELQAALAAADQRYDEAHRHSGEAAAALAHLPPPNPDWSSPAEIRDYQRLRDEHDEARAVRGEAMAERSRIVAEIGRTYRKCTDSLCRRAEEWLTRREFYWQGPTGNRTVAQGGRCKDCVSLVRRVNLIADDPDYYDRQTAATRQRVEDQRARVKVAQERLERATAQLADVETVSEQELTDLDRARWRLDQPDRQAEVRWVAVTRALDRLRENRP